MNEVFFMRADDVRKYLGGVSKTWLYDQIKNGDFPPPTKVGRMSLWECTKVKAWAQRQVLPTKGGVET